MANTYNNIPTLSKIKMGGTTYYLKDAELRAIVDQFGTAVQKDYSDTFNPQGEALATEKAIAAFLEQKVAGLTGAMHFIGVYDSLDAYPNPQAGDVIIVGGVEYVYADAYGQPSDEANYIPAGWKELGDEGSYVRKSFTIAGLDMQNDITAAALKNALGLKALAYKDEVSGTITVVTGVQDHTYTPAGSVTVAAPRSTEEIASVGTLTPAGSVSGSVVPEGTVAAPTITVTPATAQVAHITSVGSLPSYTAAQYEAPSLAAATTGAFASEGIVAEVQEADELLVLSAASTAQAVTDRGAFNAGSYTAASFNAGSLPVLGAEQTVVTGIASATATAPAFTGISSAISAAFAGNEAQVNVKGSYEKVGEVTATFAGTEATIKHVVDTEAKTITSK